MSAGSRYSLFALVKISAYTDQKAQEFMIEIKE